MFTLIRMIADDRAGRESSNAQWSWRTAVDLAIVAWIGWIVAVPALLVIGLVGFLLFTGLTIGLQDQNQNLR
jgi:hypothetical protein